MYDLNQLVKEVWEIEKIKIKFSSPMPVNTKFTQTYRKWSKGERLPGHMTADDLEKKVRRFLKECMVTDTSIRVS